MVLAVSAALTACKREQPPKPEPPQDPAPAGETREAEQNDEMIALNNRGVGLMGRFEYPAARDVFAEVVEARPDWLDARVNLAIATLNRQQEGDVEAALSLLEGVIAEDPTHARGQFCTGLLKLYVGPPNDPLPHFMAAAEAAPDDAAAAYYVGQSLANARDHEDSLAWFERSIDADPYLRSGYYASSRALRILRRPDEAAEMLATFQRLENNPRAHTVEFKYKKMGTLGEAATIGEIDAPGAAWQAPEGDVLAFSASDLPRIDDVRRFGVTTCAIDGAVRTLVAGVDSTDGPSIWLSGAVGPDMRFVESTQVNAALWGDVDNDGLTDLYLCRDGANELWMQTEQGTFVEAAARYAVTNGSLNTVDGVLVDADHDGDLDIFCVNADGPNDLLSNNADGTFRSIGASQGIDGGDQPSRQVVIADLDADRDADIIVIQDGGPNEVFLNDRLWQYRAATDVASFQAAPLAACVHADLDADGVMDLIGVDTDGNLWSWTWTGEGLDSEIRIRGVLPDAMIVRLCTADVTGDGRLEIIASDSSGMHVIDSSWNVIQETGVTLVAPLRVDESGRPTFVALDGNGEILIGETTHDQARRFAGLSFSGAEDPGQSMRSNASGIGVQVAARVGTRWTVRDTFRASSGPGQSHGPISFGLAGASTIDFIDIEWPDGVFQSELDIPAGQVTEIAETQRQLSSCPVLFVWNGERYEFVTDLLGVGGIGYAIGPGEYAPPRPWENVLLPESIARPDADGRLSLLLTEPMEEACYLDSAALVAYDLPPGWQLVLDERMGIGDPQPTGEPRFFRREILPVRAVNERGEDVLGAIVDADLTPADPGALDRRFIGRLAGEHILELEFDQSLDAHAGEPMLIADGWVEYPYSQTSFAAWQAGATYDAPTIEARGPDGAWTTVLEQIGYPAGMPRRMSLPLVGLPAGTTAIRIRTNQEVYWDRLAVAFVEACADARRVELQLAGAQLTYAGFPKRTDGPFRLPHYDYHDREPYWDTRYQVGDYTAFGPVTDLVRAHDDGVAIFGPGEQISLSFEPVGAAPAGWTRRLVLETRGWCKDMDLFTNTGETVGPMPSSGQPAPARDVLHDRYNTRFQAGR